MQFEEKDKIVQKSDPSYVETVFEDTYKIKRFKFYYLIFIIFEEIIFQFPTMIKEVKDLGFNVLSIVIWISIRVSAKIMKLYFFEFFLCVLIFDMLKLIIKEPERFEKLKLFINKIKNI
jgi:hypothetical protein